MYFFFRYFFRFIHIQIDLKKALGSIGILTLNDDFASSLVSIGLARVEASIGHLDALEDQLPLPAVLHDLGAEDEFAIRLMLRLRG